MCSARLPGCPQRQRPVQNVLATLHSRAGLGQQQFLVCFVFCAPRFSAHMGLNSASNKDVRPGKPRTPHLPRAAGTPEGRAQKGLPVRELPSLAHHHPANGCRMGEGSLCALETQGDATVSSHQAASERRAAEHQAHLENRLEQSAGRAEGGPGRGRQVLRQERTLSRQQTDLTPLPSPGPNKRAWVYRRCPLLRELNAVPSSLQRPLCRRRASVSVGLGATDAGHLEERGPNQ